MKPIETGCTAMIINSHAGNNGTFVEVGEYIGTAFGWVGDKLWKITANKKVRVGGAELLDGNKLYAATYQLMRVDDYHEDEQEKATKLIEEAA